MTGFIFENDLSNSGLLYHKRKIIRILNGRTYKAMVVEPSISPANTGIDQKKPTMQR